MTALEFGGERQSGRPKRNLREAIIRGFLGRCPKCGEGKLFRSYARVVDNCAVCGEDLSHHRADDLPAYLVIVIIGHIVFGGFMAVEASVAMEMWQHLAIWVPVTIVSSLLWLQPIKGAVVGLQWANYMHGFGDEKDMIESHPEA